MSWLQNSVAGLRRALGPDAVDVGAAGYVLRIDWTRTDLHRFERLASEGRRRLAAGDPAEAAETLRIALNLWRGEPLGDIGSEPWARPEVARLEELRLAATEDRIDAGLALGNRAVLPMVARLVVHHPRRGRLRGQLILALHNDGRKTEAFAAFEDAQRFFTDVDGGPLRNELRALRPYLPMRDWLGNEPTLDAYRTLIPDPDPDTELSVALGSDESSISTLADRQPRAQATTSQLASSMTGRSASAAANGPTRRPTSNWPAAAPQNSAS